MSTRRLSGVFDLLHERVGARPLHLVVFAVVVTAIALLQTRSTATLRAPALGWAPTVEHPSPTPTWVEQVFVRPGDHVEAGAPLALLSGFLLERELAQIDARIERLHREAELGVARFTVDYLDRQVTLESTVEKARRGQAIAQAREERMRRLTTSSQELLDRLGERLEQRMARLDDVEKTGWLHETFAAEAAEATVVARAEGSLARELGRRLESRPDLLRLAEPMLAFYEASLRELEAERHTAVETMRRLSIVASTSGRVEAILPKGASAAPGVPVATIVPAGATELIAYVTPRSNPGEFTAGTRVAVAAAGCPGEAEVLRAGAAVAEAPLQLQTRWFTPVRGLPVHLSVPEGCHVGMGQVLSVRIERPLW